MNKMEKMAKIVEEMDEEGELEQFESEVEILNEIGIELTEKELRIVNDLMYLVHKKVSKNEASSFMYR